MVNCQNTRMRTKTKLQQTTSQQTLLKTKPKEHHTVFFSIICLSSIIMLACIWLQFLNISVFLSGVGRRQRGGEETVSWWCQGSTPVQGVSTATRRDTAALQTAYAWGPVPFLGFVQGALPRQSLWWAHRYLFVCVCVSSLQYEYELMDHLFTILLSRCPERHTWFTASWSFWHLGWSSPTLQKCFSQLPPSLEVFLRPTRVPDHFTG